MFFGKKKRRATRITTLIGQRTEIKGDINFTGCIQIDGTISGNVTADNDGSSVLLLSDLGSIKGEVRAPYLVINGAVQGDVYGYEHVELANKACIAGDVYYALLEMTKGAEMNGNLVHGMGEQEAALANPQEIVAGMNYAYDDDSK